MNSHCLSQTKRFYLALGCHLIVDTEHYLRFKAPDNDTSLSFSLSSKVSPEAVIYFETDQLDAIVASLQTKGITIEQAPSMMPYLWREAIIRDPSGHQIKLYHAGENRLNPPWRVMP